VDEPLNCSVSGDLPCITSVDPDARGATTKNTKIMEISKDQTSELMMHVITNVSYWRELLVGMSQMQKRQQGNCLKSYDEWATQIVSTLGNGLGMQDDHVQNTLESLKKLDFMPLDVSESSGLRNLNQEAKTALLSSILGAMLKSNSGYDARSRVLLRRIAESIQMDISAVSSEERGCTSNGLLQLESTLSADLDQVLSSHTSTTTQVLKKHTESSKFSRTLATASATILGGVLIGVTGGLAAPMIAAGLGTALGAIGLTTTAAAVATTLAADAVLVGTIFGIQGAGQVGNVVDRNMRSISDFSFIPLYPIAAHKLHVVIGIAGLAPPQANFLNATSETSTIKFLTGPWRILGPQGETYTLTWESESLINMSKAIESFAATFFTSSVVSMVVKQTAFGALESALTWPMTLVKVANLIDNPWRQCISLADKASLVLADVLLEKPFGARPVTLVAFGIGARLVLNACLELEKRGGFGLVENVIVMGAPFPGHVKDSTDWKRIRSLVSGRLVNCYSTSDHLLAFVHRGITIAGNPVTLKDAVAGLGEIQLDGVENYNVTNLIPGHLAYALATGQILEKIGFEDLDLAKVDVQIVEKEMLMERRNATALFEATDAPTPTSPENLEFDRLEFADRFISQLDRGHERTDSRLSVVSNGSFRSDGSFVETVFDADKMFSDETSGRDAKIELSEEWACSKCTFLNKHDAGICEMCENVQ
jgi:hypothetical protein